MSTKVKVSNSDSVFLATLLKNPAHEFSALEIQQIQNLMKTRVQDKQEIKDLREEVFFLKSQRDKEGIESIEKMDGLKRSLSEILRLSREHLAATLIAATLIVTLDP